MKPPPPSPKQSNHAKESLKPGGEQSYRIKQVPNPFGVIKIGVGPGCPKRTLAD